MKAQILTPWLTDGDNRPQLTDDYPCSWQDVTGQQAYQIPTLPNAYVVEAMGVDQAWLDDVAADDTYVILWSAEDDAAPTGTVTSEQLAALRAAFSTASPTQLDRYVGTEPAGRTVAEVAEKIVAWSSLFLRQDEMAPEDYAALVNRYPPYEVGVAYTAGDLFAYENELYEVVQGHTSQADWQPDTTPALYKHAVPQSVVPIWVQPLGSHDAYQLGDRVTHNGQVWESTAANNVWEPGGVGTGSLWVVVG